MSIGDALATARRQAGLTITQVSQRTCIRETIVRGIERGDYSGCGGDFYARGHIRSIARVVGLDPEELVREYDATHAPSQPITAAEVFQPFTPVKLKERRRPNWSLVLLAGVVAVLAIVGFRYFSHSSNSPSRPTASTQTDHKTQTGHKAAAHPTTTPTAHTVPPPSRVRVTVLAVPGSVTYAKYTSHGRLIFAGDVGAASRKVSKRGTEPLIVEILNPGAVHVYLDGHRVYTETTKPVTLSCTRQGCTPS